MAKKTYDTEVVRATANEFRKNSEDFNTALQKITGTIKNYIDANQNDAGRAAEKKWQEAQPHLNKVAEFFQEFGKGLDTQAKTLEETESNLSKF